jgi:signal transduction histidine kinase
MPEIDTILALTLDQILLIPETRYAAAYLCNETTPDRLHLAGAAYRKPTRQKLPQQVAVSGTILEEALSQQIPLNIPKASEFAGFRLSAGIVVPLTAAEATLGVVVVASEGAGSLQPETTNAQLIAGAVRQAAVALRSARLLAHERHQRQLAQTLRAAVSATSGLQNYETILQILLHHLRQLLAFDSADVYVATENAALQQRVSADYSERGLAAFRVSYSMIETKHYPALRSAVEAGKLSALADVHPDSPLLAPNVPPARGVLLCPLQQRGRILGVLALRYKQPHTYDHESYEVVEAFADQFALATANARLFTIKQDQLSRVVLLEGISSLFSGTLTVAEALDQVLTELSTFLDYDTANVMFIENQMIHMVAWRSKYLQEPFVQSVPISSLSGIQRVYQTRAPLLIENTDLPVARWSDLGNREPDLVVKSWIGAPLLVRGEVIGVLNVDSVTPNAFRPGDMKVVHSLANRLSMAIENERLLREVSHRSRTFQILNEVIFAANRNLALEPLINVVLEKVLEALNIHAGTIHLLEPGSGHLNLRAAIGLSDRTQNALRFIRTTDPLPMKANGLTFFSIPFMAKESLVGMLSLLDSPEQPISQYDPSLLLTLCDQIAVTLENARLYEAALENARRSTELRRLGLAITGTLNQQEVLDLVASESATTFDVESVYIWLVDGDEVRGAHYYDANNVDRSYFLGLRVSIDEGTTLGAYLVKTRNPMYVNRAREARDLPVNQALLEKMDGLSLMGVPLIKGDQVFGSIVLISTRDPDHFNDDFLEQMILLSIQTALALDNANLFAETQRRLTQLRLVNDIGRYATGILVFEALMESVGQQLYAVLKYDTITLYLVEDQKITVRFALAHGEKIPANALPKGLLPLVGTVGQVVKTGEPVLVQDISQLVRMGAIQARGEMVVPLILGADVIGALSVERAGANTIHQEDLDVMQPLAAHLAVSIANAQLFERVQHQNLALEERVYQRTLEIYQQRERIEAILSSVGDAIIVTDLSGRQVLANPVASALFDSKHGQDEAQKLNQVIGQLSQRPETETEMVIEIGPYTFQAKASKFMENDQLVGTVIVLRDITRLQEVDRLKSDFVSQVSHELRTPMSNIKLYLSLLKRGKTEKYDSYMMVVEKEAQRLERLISDLLDISRLDYARRTATLERLSARERLEVNPIIEQVILNHTPQARLRQITLRQQLGEGLPDILANRDQIIQVLTNLVGNAIVYTMEGGAVEVNSYLQHKTPDQPWVVMEVSDTGIGISEADQEHIFERFYRGTTPETLTPPGTGLGLAITKEIVEMHHGLIEVNSQVGQGSSFRVYLPVVKTSANGTIEETINV